MAQFISLTVSDTQFRRWLERAISVVRDASPIMREVAGVLADESEEAFQRQADPSTGVPWERLKDSTIEGREARGHWPGKILQVTGGLAQSITTDYGANFAAIGSNKEYAAIQQLGGQTRPHVILPRNKKALAFKGILAKRVNHPGSKLPARPYMGLSTSGQQEIGVIFERVLTNTGSL